MAGEEEVVGDLGEVLEGVVGELLDAGLPALQQPLHHHLLVSRTCGSNTSPTFLTRPSPLHNSPSFTHSPLSHSLLGSS